jgi:hypothetical protein
MSKLILCLEISPYFELDNSFGLVLVYRNGLSDYPKVEND